MVLLLPMTVQAEKAQLELRVKSAFIYNFTKYITWQEFPGNSDADSLRICVVRDRDVYDLMRETIARKPSQGRIVDVVLLRDRVDMRDCHVAYVPESRTTQDWRSELQSTGLVTVGEGSQFVDDGGVFGFVIVDDKIRFEINLALAERKGLKISSKLLSLAKRVVY